MWTPPLHLVRSMALCKLLNSSKPVSLCYRIRTSSAFIATTGSSTSPWLPPFWLLIFPLVPVVCQVSQVHVTLLQKIGLKMNFPERSCLKHTKITRLNSYWHCYNNQRYISRYVKLLGCFTLCLQVPCAQPQSTVCTMDSCSRSSRRGYLGTEWSYDTFSKLHTLSSSWFDFIIYE